MPAGFYIVQHACFGKDPVELDPSCCVPFKPSLEVRHSRQQVSLAAVARVVR